jgi:hypothetical protein
MDASKTEIQLRAGAFRQRQRGNAPATPITMTLHTSQNLRRGDITVHTLQVEAPSLLRLKSHGMLTTWGKTLRMQAEVSESDVASWLRWIPASVYHRLPVWPTQGQMAMTLTVHGALPTLSTIQALQLPDCDLTLRWRNMQLAQPGHRQFARHGRGDVRITAHDNTVTIGGEIGLADMVLPGDRPITFRTTFDYALQEKRRLHIRSHDFQLVDQGVRLGLQGTVDGLTTLLNRQRPVDIGAILQTLEAHLTLTQALDKAQGLAGLAAGFPVHGRVQNSLVVTLRPGKTLELSGDFQVRDLGIEYAPLFQLTGLTGTLHYHKRLELRASATSPTPTPGGGRLQPYHVRLLRRC